MSELQILRGSIKVRVGEAVYEVKKPNNREIYELSKQDETDLKGMITFLDKLGLPEAVAWEIDPESLASIFAAITPQKKS
jgi:hypothetical protein